MEGVVETDILIFEQFWQNKNKMRVLIFLNIKPYYKVN